MALTERIRKAKDAYIASKPAISYERARLFTESHKMTEGEAVPIRRAKAFKYTCEHLPVTIFEGELLVGATGEFRKCGILTRNSPGPGSTGRWTASTSASRIPTR